MRNMEEQIGYKGGWKGEGMRGWVGRKIKEYWTNKVKGNEKWNRCEGIEEFGCPIITHKPLHQFSSYFDLGLKPRKCFQLASKSLVGGLLQKKISKESWVP